MGLGHSWSPKFRITPPAGAVYEVDVSAYQWIRTCQRLVERLASTVELADYSMDQVRHGYHQRARLVFEFFTPSANETDFSDRVLAAADGEDDDWKVELSLDAGVTYREVLLEEHEESPSIEDKLVGVIVATTWVCKDPIDKKPAIGAGAW